MLRKPIARWWNGIAIASQLEELLIPAIATQANYYRQLGLRSDFTD